MIFYVPEYYENFKCIAEKCRKSCCVHWEIDIDDKSLETYKNTGGEFGKFMKDNISEEGFNHFVLTKDRRCPMLNEQGLCKIFIEIGEDKLCDVCTNHPRFYEWFDKAECNIPKAIKEGGVGISCEVGCTLALQNDVVWKYKSIEVPDDENIENGPDFKYNSENFSLYKFYSDCRNIVYKIIQSKDISYKDKISMMIAYGKQLQDNLDSENFTEPDDIKFEDVEVNVKFVLEKMLTFDFIEYFNKAAWQNDLDNFDKYNSRTDDILKEQDFEKYLLNVMQYFIMRYFIKGVYTGEVLSSIGMACASAEFLRLRFADLYYFENVTEFNELVLAVCNLSSEAEYSDENMDCFADLIYSEDFLIIK